MYYVMKDNDEFECTKEKLEDAKTEANRIEGYVLDAWSSRVYESFDVMEDFLKLINVSRKT